MPGARLRYGPEYIIPVPFDPRLISAVPPAVAKAAMDSGVARQPIIDIGPISIELSARLDPTAVGLQRIFDQVRDQPKRVVFAEGEEEKVIRAAIAFRHAGYGTPILVGREERIAETIKHARPGRRRGPRDPERAASASTTSRIPISSTQRLQRHGFLQRDCQRMVNQDRNVFAACMVATGDADAMVTGLTRSFDVCLRAMRRGASIRARRPALFGALDRAGARPHRVHRRHHGARTADRRRAGRYRRADGRASRAQLGHEPRVALLSFSNFGNPPREKARAHPRGGGRCWTRRARRFRI